MSAQRTPGPDDLRFAAEWLRAYDDTHDGGAQTAIATSVARWLDKQADAGELRAVAKEHGVPVGKLRAKLAEYEAKPEWSAAIEKVAKATRSAS